ncbi:DUF1109 domain-containing protein [Sphingobium sp. Sx8-8]|uniref:NrsF family protein n=1 Tax=Sphingobium sp. Sx8-8 TaxID=2933617 RepID=UPI001F5996C8|nr:DUF1109 domain-containing protein [Sphingobium sp. Sx8-8]
MTSTDALILNLSSDLAPVRRRNMLREIALLVALGAAELGVILWTGAMRPDMGLVILSPYMIWKMGSLALLAGMTCTIAMRSLAPPASSRRGLMLALGTAALAIAGGLLVTSAADSGRSLLDRLSPVHGMLCATTITVLAMPMMAALGVLMRRAAPVRPKESALACGLAAATCAALIFTLCCPMNDPLYIAVWYSLGVTFVALAARWLLPRRFRL